MGTYLVRRRENKIAQIRRDFPHSVEVIEKVAVYAERDHKETDELILDIRGRTNRNLNLASIVTGGILAGYSFVKVDYLDLVSEPDGSVSLAENGLVTLGALSAIAAAMSLRTLVNYYIRQRRFHSDRERIQRKFPTRDFSYSPERESRKV